MAILPTLERWALLALSPAAADPSATADAVRAEAARAARALHHLGARAVPAGDPEYPRGLRDLADAPAVVFARGSALPSIERAVAVVGARAASPYGLMMASRLSSDLARMGFTVVSGLARGVDAAAHRGAIDAGGTTVAVLPSGLDCVTPAHHQDLADAIAGQGTLVTELARGGPRFRGEFVRRNRLIAAMAAVTVVVEAATRSGALTTAAVARALGRFVLAVPGDVDRPTARGTNALLRAGARPCESAGDVARAVEAWRAAAAPDMAASAPAARRDGAGAADRAASTSRSTPEASVGSGGSWVASAEASALPLGDGGSAEARLLEALGEEPAPVEAIAARAGLGLSETLAGLLALEWAGSATALPGQRWMRAGG